MENDPDDRVSSPKSPQQPHAVTTLYYTCDSGVFKSSESSVQVVSAGNNSNCNAPPGYSKPNFCELDIISKKEKLKINVDFVPLQTITEELKTLSMSSKLKNPKASGFRKKIYRKPVNSDEPNEVLRLANVLKGDCEAYRPQQNRSKEFFVVKNHQQANMVDEISQTVKKKRRSKSRKRNLEAEGPHNKTKTDYDNFGTPTEMVAQFGDLSAAKAMYYAELPNVSAFVEEKVESAEVEDKHRKKHKKKSKKSKGCSATRDHPTGDDAEYVEEVIINKVENDFPQVSSPGSITTVPSRAFNKDSEFSFGSLKVPKSTNVEFRQRTNSPNATPSFLDDALRKYKTDTAVYKGRHRKKHRTSPRLSSEDEVAKTPEERPTEATQETEVKVIYKVDEGKNHPYRETNRDKKKKRSKKTTESPSATGKEEKSPHKRRSKSMIADEKVQKNQDKHKSDKTITEKPNKQSEKDDSVLNLYQTNKSLQSESCTMIVDEEYLKHTEKRKRKSRKSRSPSPNNKKAQTPKEDAKIPAEDDVVLLHSAKERKTKQRSKSRVTEEKSHKKRYKSKAPTPKEEVSEELVKKISRKSASDVSKKDIQSFDGHKSLEGVRNESKSEKTQTGTPAKKHKHSPTDIVAKTSQTEVKTAAEEFPYKVGEATILPMTKEKRKRSKSYAPKKVKELCSTDRPPVASKSHVFDVTSSRQSEDHVPPKKLPRSKKSKSRLQQTSQKQQIVTKDRFYEELKRISNIQQIESSRKRFKVVSRTVTAKTSDDSAAYSTEQSRNSKKMSGSRRFKTLMCSEKEKQAILKLPMCKKSIEDDANEPEILEQKNTKHECETSEMEDGLVKCERSKRKKKIRRTISRKEVGFSHLNISPLVDMYRRPSKSTFYRKTIERKVVEIPKLTRQYDSRDVSVHSELISEDTDFSAVGAKESVRKLNPFTMVLSEKILEICTKAIGTDGKISEGFTVSGCEPPKRFKSHESRKDKLKLMAKVSRLHFSYHPPVAIINGVMQPPESKLVVKNFEITPEITEEQPPVVEAIVNEAELTFNQQGHEVSTYKSPIFLKTKRKFAFMSKGRRSRCSLKKDSLGKLVAKKVQTSTDSRSNSDTIVVETKECATDPNNEESETTRTQQKSTPKIEIKNPSRINSAVKLMESSLQIIKEESQSTDSSSKVSSRKSNQNKEVQNKQCELEIKETQTDLQVEDIDKIKEVITLLYNTIDQKKPVMQESVATTTVNSVEVQPEIIKHVDSSTESSSYHEQFKNFVRNVTPRFCSVKKSGKNSLSNLASTPTKIPMVSSKRASTSKIPTCNKAGSQIASDIISTSERSSSSSERKPQKNQKNLVRKRSSSADVLTSGYYEKYQNTKALIEQQRKRRAESADSMMRKRKPDVQAEFKSSTSVSDFSSVVLSYKGEQQPRRSEEKCIQCVLVAEIPKEDKNIGTVTEDEKEKISPVSSKKSLLTKVKSSLSCASKENVASLNDNSGTSQKDDRISEKDCQDKSLQTSAHLEPRHKCKINVLYADIPYKSPGKKQILNDLFQRVSSHSFISPRKSPTKIGEKSPIRNNEKVNRFDSLRRVFSRKNEHVLQNNLFNYNMSDRRKKTHSKRGPEHDYINLIKLERHLEQVLGLYPSIFKAIRSQIDDSTVRKLDKRLKAESPDLFTSNDTLATTIETVTEYKHTDSFDRYPSFSESNLDRFNRYCEALNLPGQEYHLQKFLNSQNGSLRHYLRRPVNVTKKSSPAHEDKTGKSKLKQGNNTKGQETHPQSDSTSNSSRKQQKVKGRSRPQVKKPFKAKSKKRNKIEKADSKLSFFNSDSSSSSCADNWSVASPLYSVTTPSLNFSVLGVSRSGTNLMLNKPTQTKITKSHSAIEMSSVSRINRKLALKHIDDGSKYVKEKQNVLVVSVNSSCTVFATPSKFLSKVEKHLKKNDDVKKVDRQKKRQPPMVNKKQVDEQSLHSLFFSDGNAVKSPAVGSEVNAQKPFYIHGNDKRDAREEVADHSDAQPLTNSAKDTLPKEDEEDMGNFSADSLETHDSQRKNSLGYACNVVANRFDELRQTPQQNFFVYSNTVQYDRDMNSTKVREDQNTRDQNAKSGNNAEDTSKTLLSESGYESTKSKRTASIKNFFKKGGSLLDIFKNNNYKNKIANAKTAAPVGVTLTNFSDLYARSNDVTEDDYTPRRDSPCRSDNTVYWTTTVKGKRKTTFGELAGPSGGKREKSASPKRSKGTSISSVQSCACSNPATSYQRQMDECHAYAEKVLLESQMRREGYYKQYQDFKEIPLELLIGKRMPNKYKYAQEVAVQTKPKLKPTSTQSRKSTRMKGVDATSPVAYRFNAAVKTDDPPPEIVALRSESPVKLGKDLLGDDTEGRDLKIEPSDEVLVEKTEPPLTSDVEITVYRTESRFRSRGTTPPPVRIYEPPREPRRSEKEAPPPKKRNRSLGRLLGKGSSSWHDAFTRRSARNKEEPKTKDQATVVHISRKDKHDKEKDQTERDKSIITRFTRFCRPKTPPESLGDTPGCTCDGRAVPGPKRAPSPPPKTPSPPSELTEESAKKSISSSLVIPPPTLSQESSGSFILRVQDSTIEDQVHMEALVRQMVEEAMILSDLHEDMSDGPVESIELVPSSPKIVSPPAAVQQPAVQLPPPTEMEGLQEQEQEQHATPSVPAEKQEEPEICRRSSEDFRKGLTDKEVFDKLLNSFEKEEEIATRLSKDEEFFHDQIKKIKKESDESIVEESTTKDPNENIYSEDMAGKHRSTHFWEEKMKAMKAKEENPVKEDDIGTCFSRGFRPDNIALSGDACFSLNKQDRLKFSKGMLTSEESIIDFSERETPLDFLLALGFMVDEASNALKDEDIRSRLLAAITEARVWINKITTTQGTLLYLVAYKSRPKTMRYFLQLVEAIINKRINNAIKLDGFLRVLEKVEEGEIQMINILGADKFEDEENEEKIVRKQLRQLFITVYKIAEKEAMLKGKQLSQQAIVLLRILAAKYRAGLHPHLELIARYIGQELLNTETQLEAAMIFLSRLDTAEVKLKEFEAYCDIKCERKKKKVASRTEVTALEKSASVPDAHFSEFTIPEDQIPELEELRMKDHVNYHIDHSAHEKANKKKSTKSSKSK